MLTVLFLDDIDNGDIALFSLLRHNPTVKLEGHTQSITALVASTIAYVARRDLEVVR